jgi:glycyl-tRNA synthetase beta chain
MSGASLLVELFTEELPPRALKQLGDAFADRILHGLARLGLAARSTPGMKVFATPRRLAVLIPQVREKAADRVESRKLMPASVAFGADGGPTTALAKRLEKEGASAAQIERRTEGGADYVYLNRTMPGATLAAGLQLALEDAVANLPIPKVMSYQLADGATTVRFVRPAHGLLALHGERIVEVSVLGLKAGRVTHGHRFQGVRDISVATADAYEEALAAHGKVVASFAARRAGIARELCARAAETGASLGAESEYAALLDEVTALVENPAVYAGEFGADFLAVPQECLVLTMRANQKYFPLFDAAGRLINRFLIVSNMRLENPDNIVAGNERVIRPRLADARFFFDTDRKTPLAERVARLAGIVYHNKLGSQLDRMGRVRALAGMIAAGMGADAAVVDRAALLAKADLVTLMVGEFPELQGTMGRYYALADGEDPRVADAIEQHYRPRFAGDALPAGDAATALALADKLEALAGLFGIGQQPTGDKDPFALRRHALGVVRMLVERQLPLSLSELLNCACAAFPHGMLRESRAELRAFMLERLRGYLREAGYGANEIEAVLCLDPDELRLVPRQLEAVRAFLALPEAESLAAANKRVANILRQAGAKGESFRDADPAMLREPAERTLFEALQKATRQAAALYQQGDYAGYLSTFAVLKAPVDAFFDSVMVMVDDAALRRNRLALLEDLRREMNRIADLSRLAA